MPRWQVICPNGHVLFLDAALKEQVTESEENRNIAMISHSLICPVCDERWDL